MSYSHYSDKNSDKLSDTWALVSFQNEGKIILSGSSTPPNSLSSSMEKWLLDAQREAGTPRSDRSSEEHTSRNSDYQPHLTDISLHTNSQDAPVINHDWVVDWSSRPEVPSPLSVAAWHAKMKHFELQKKQKMNNSKSPIVLLLVSHACSFLIGAAIAFLYLRRCHVSNFGGDVV